MIRSPRLLDADFREADVLPPVAFSLTDKLTPLSMASLTLPCDAPEVPVRSFVELYTADGSAGIFRVTNLRTTPGEVRELTLQHGLCTLSDHMHRGESTQTGSLRTLLTQLLSNQTDWALGTVDVSDDKELTWECSNTNDLQGLLSIMQELPGYYLDFDQTARPWLLHVRARSTEVECEARFDRNVTQAQIEYDTTDMCTLAYADGLEAPIEADTAGTWGSIERHVSADEALGQDVITATVQRYLEQRKDPRVTITITAMELSQLTGEPFDSFRKGQLCRCILSDMTAVQRIEAIERPDPIGEPEHVVLTLASTQDDLSITVAGMVVDIRHVNQLYQQLDRNLRIEAETIDMIAQQLRLYAYQSEVDGLSTRVNTVEVDLDAAEATLLLKASQTDMDDVLLRLNAAEGTLTAQANEIYLKANKTYVDNLVAEYVKASELEADVINVVNSTTTWALTATSLTAAWITTTGTAKIAGVETEFITAGTGRFDTLYSGDAVVATQAWVQEQGYLTSASLELKTLYVMTSVEKVMNSAGYVTDVISTGTTITYYT